MSRKIAIVWLIVLAAGLPGLAQENGPAFSVELSTDSVLIGNYFEVNFKLKNAKGGRFDIPDIGTDFHVISGPNYASSMSVINGEVSQQMTISYILEPKEIGLFYIPPASIEAGDTVLESAPVEVLVVPNPDGIRQSPPNHSQGFNLEREFPLFEQMLPPPGDSPLPPGEQPSKKKKRKTIRI